MKIKAMNTKRMVKDRLYEQVSRITKAASSPKRLELIELLCQCPKSVEVLARESDLSVKLTSAHLKELRLARLVEAERQGKYSIYRLTNFDVARFWVTIRELAESHLSELQNALQQLNATTHEWVGTGHDELLEKAKNGEIIVIDVRPREEYDVDHIPFARSMPLAELKVHLSELPKDVPVVAYCRGPFCLMSSDAVRLLRSNGFAASQLKEGVAEWSAISGTKTALRDLAYLNLPGS